MLNRFTRLLVALCVVCVMSCFLSGCQHKRTLLFLNWGEYINDDMVEQFEKQYNCNVIVDLADSNELFYAKLKNGTTAYDLCCPAEYMVEKMYLTGLIQRIDHSKLTRYTDDMYMDEVYNIEALMNETMKEECAKLGRPYDYEGNEINQYHMPYYWGTFGLMYNCKNPTFKDEKTYDVDGKWVSDVPDGDPDIFQKDNNAWKVYFFDPTLPEEDSLPLSTKVGQYGDAVRFSYAAVFTYLQGTPNADPTVQENLNSFKEVLSRRKYTEWGGDTLKKGIESHNLDIAFSYTGDCLDMVYLRILDGMTFEEIVTTDFYTYTPSVTPAHIDTLVIPSNARHVDLAHEFIDFLLDPVACWYNNRDIGYCAPLKETYRMIVNAESPAEDSWAYVERDEEELFWLENWAKTIATTFPVDAEGKSIKKGTPMSFFDNEDLKKLNNIVNNIKAK